MIKKILIWGGLFLLSMAILIQFFPYGRNHTNPPVVAEPNWDSEKTRTLAVSACFDCHSNETVWPWYSYIAPVSWLIQNDVDEGRRRLNFSEWPSIRETDELGEVILEGFMPPQQFLLLHPEARLTESQRRDLAKGLIASAR